MTSIFANVKKCKEVGSLSGRGKDSGNTTLQICNFCCYSIICGVLQTGIEVSFCLKIEELSHFISSIIFISGTLINRECAWFTLRRSVTGMETFSLDFKVTHEFSSFLMWNIASIKYCINIGKIVMILIQNFIMVLERVWKIIPTNCDAHLA